MVVGLSPRRTTIYISALERLDASLRAVPNNAVDFLLLSLHMHFPFSVKTSYLFRAKPESGREESRERKG